MQRFLFLISVLCISYLANAQAPAAGRVVGVVVDAKTGQGLEYATVVLRNVKDSTVTGGLTDEKGRFAIENMKLGMYNLEVSFLGYITLTQSMIKVVPPTQNVDLGNLKMNENATELQTVTITAEKQMLQLGAEKKVFNVDKNAMAAGGSALEAIKQIPTVDVDMEGNINMRGSGNVLILVNGKPSGLTGNSKQAILEALPANSIESIEIISNPSAKYDADGTSGIINIVLKKNYNSGLNGSANVSYSTKYKNSAGISINNRKNKINFSSSYNFNFRESYFKGTQDRKNFSELFTNTINSYDYTRTFNYNHSLNLSLDYDINAKNTFSITNLANANHGTNETTTDVDFLNINDVFYSGYDRYADSKRRNFSDDLGLSYRKTFAEQGREWTAAANYSYNNRYNPADYIQNDFDSLLNPIAAIAIQEYNLTKGTNHILTVQSDYVHPFQKHGKLEAGVKMTFRDIFTDFYADSLNRTTGATEFNATLSNTYRYTEEINAAYSTFSGTVKKFSYKAGLRMEQANINVDNSQEAVKTKRHYVDFFPSVFLTQKLPKSHELQFSYSRRINRPNPFMLNPFADYSNPLNIFKGNPELQPEYINSLEFTYVKNWKSIFLTATTYYRQANDNFTRIRFVDSVTAVSVVTWSNITSSQNIGEEVIFRAPITKWWNILANVNVYQNYMKGDIPNGDNDLSTNSFQWNFRVQTSFKFWKNADLQLSYRYNSRIEFLQGYIRPMQNLDIGFRKELLKGKGILAFNVQDLFNQRRFYIITGGSNFSGVSDRRFETRIATLSFTYKFGKQENAPKKRQTPGNMDDSMMQQGF